MFADECSDAKGRASTTWGALMGCFKALPGNLEHAGVARAAEAEESIHIVLHSIGTRSSIVNAPPFSIEGTRPDGERLLDCFEQMRANIETLDVALEFEGEDARTARLFAHKGWRRYISSHRRLPSMPPPSSPPLLPPPSSPPSPSSLPL